MNNNNELDNKIDETDDIVDIENDELADLDQETFTYTVDNNNVNNDYNKSVYNDKKSYVYILIGIFILVFIIVLLIIFVNKNKSKNEKYSDIESKLVSASEKYYDKHSDMLPVMDGSTVTVSADTLIEESFMKPFSEFVSEDVSCSGYVSVSNSGNEYVYFPYLKCDDEYESIKLSQKIISDDLVTSGDGLYNTASGYVYRGEYPNNYVTFNGKSWRIIGINSDGSLRLIYNDKKVQKNSWDDRYNSEKGSYTGINDFRVSRLLEYLNKSYEENEYVDAKNKKLLVKHDWCIGKVSSSDSLISDLNLCSDVYSDTYIGVVSISDILIPSIDANCNSIYDIECTNYNYFFNINTGWTLNASSDNSYVAFSSNGGSLFTKNASNENNIRPVLNINGNILYKSGDGTSEHPYVISY